MNSINAPFQFIPIVLVSCPNVVKGGECKCGYDGFYPVVYNASGRCVAHGKDASAVGLGIEAVALGGAGSPEES